MTVQLYLGVDAGNTKTDALLCDGQGRVVGYARAGIGDIYGADSPEAAVAAVRGAVLAALDSAGVRCQDVRPAAFRLAGVDWLSDAEYWREAMPSALPGLAISSITNDGYAAIRCGVPHGSGIAVVVGTGPAVAARNTATGAMWSLGWWAQEQLGAMGLGHDAVRAVCRAELGIAPPTALTQRLLTFYDVDTAEALLEAFTRRDHPLGLRHKALAAPQVSAAAAECDEVALAILVDHASHLAEYAEAAARMTGLLDFDEAIAVVLSGSVLTAEPSPLADELKVALPLRLPDSTIALARLAPVAGAVLDAMAEDGSETVPHAWNTLAESSETQAVLPG